MQLRSEDECGKACGGYLNCGLGMRVAAARVVGEAAAVRVGMLAEPAEAAEGGREAGVGTGYRF